MLKQFQLFLGPTMTRVFVLWFGLTGLASLILNAFAGQNTWVRAAQSAIVLVFLVGVAVIMLSRLSPGERGRWVALLLPTFIALLLGLFVLPQYSALLLGGGLGWIVAGLFLSRSRLPMHYREAVKHLRRSEYADAVKVMEAMIDTEPDQANHYRFRAEIYRLWGKLKFALRDYQQMVQLDPDSAVAYNGLAEVNLQLGDYPAAVDAARKANQLAPDDWVTFYNLGMIEDRLADSQNVIDHLDRALALKVPDTRHRLLIHFYRLRAYLRLDQMAQAEQELKTLKHYQNGWHEWQTILSSEQAETLRNVLGDDIESAGQLLSGSLSLVDLKRS